MGRWACVLALAGCGEPTDPSTDADADSDSDSDPDADTDADGFSDKEESDCGSDPADAESICYACGWRRGDPGDLVATGAAEGDTIENVHMIDQCGEEVPLWDFAGEYHILFLTAAW